jgi:chemotaxis protein MotB
MAIAHEEEQTGIPEWVVTFGDMMTLLLTFFVLLFSMSEIKQEQSIALIESLHRQFGNETASFSLLPGRFPPSTSALNRLPSLGRARRMNTMNGGDKVRAPVGDYPRVTAIRPAQHSTQGGAVWFEEGRSQLAVDQRRTLRAIAEMIGGKPQKIEIRGHTSSRPLAPSSPYAQHWDLAYARCLNVMQCLIQHGVNPKRIRIGVAAENEPLHAGYDEQLRKRNARVEVYLLDTLTEELDPAKPQRPNRDTTSNSPS